MKRLALLTALMFMAIATTFAQKGVKWEEGTLEDVLAKAQKNPNGPQLIFMDCYTSWCGPCKYMKEKVLTTEKAGDYFNEKFLNFKMDMETANGPELVKKYGVNMYPTFLILDPYGNIVGNVIGKSEVDAFIAKVQDAAVYEGSPAYYIQRFKQSKDTKDAYGYLEACSSLNLKDNVKQFVNEHFFDFAARNSAFSKRFWKYLERSVTAAHPEVIRYILDNKGTYDLFIGSGKVEDCFRINLKQDLTDYLNGKLQLEKENVLNACTILSLAGDGTYLTNLIIRLAKAQADNDTEAIIKAYRTVSYGCNEISYNCTMRDMYTCLSMLLANGNIPDSQKKAFIQAYKDAFEQNLAKLEKAAKKAISNYDSL